MRKKAPRSRKALSSSSSPGSAVGTKRTASNNVMKLRSTEKMKRTAQQSEVNVDNKKPRSSKKPKVQAKKKTEKVDPKRPKKPPTAFFYFLEDFRKGYQEQNPDVKSMRDIGKACGDKWKTMSYEEKVQYYDIATVKRAEFDRAMAEYIKRKESGEDQETDEDSEYE